MSIWGMQLPPAQASQESNFFQAKLSVSLPGSARIMSPYWPQVPLVQFTTVGVMSQYAQPAWQAAE